MRVGCNEHVGGGGQKKTGMTRTTIVRIACIQASSKMSKMKETIANIRLEKVTGDGARSARAS